MPNGGDGNTAYNYKWCEERHDHVEKEFITVWRKLDGFDKKLWGIIILLVANFGGIIGIFFK